MKASVEVGDLIAWTANHRGIHMGIVYGFDVAGNPLIIRHSDEGKQMITRGSFLVIGRKTSPFSDPKITSAWDWWENYDLPV